MELLLLAAMLWVATHVGLSGTPAREALVARLGEGRFMALYSVLSVAAIALLVGAYRAAPWVVLWVSPAWLRWLVVGLMLPASVLLVGSVAGPNPTAVGQRAGAPHGVQRITRHPMMVAITAWALLHLLANGDAASFLFFGAFAATTLAGMPSIDRKLAARQPEGWARLSAETSIVPGAAVLAGRTRLAWPAVSGGVLAGGLVLWAILLAAHPVVVGVPAVP